MGKKKKARRKYYPGQAVVFRTPFDNDRNVKDYLECCLIVRYDENRRCYLVKAPEYYSGCTFHADASSLMSQKKYDELKDDVVELAKTTVIDPSRF